MLLKQHRKGDWYFLKVYTECIHVNQTNLQIFLEEEINNNLDSRTQEILDKSNTRNEGARGRYKKGASESILEESIKLERFQDSKEN